MSAAGDACGVEVFLPFDRSRPTAGTVAADAGALVVTAAGERLALASGTVSLALGGENGERVVVEGLVASGSPRAGSAVYLQSSDRSLLGRLATAGPPELRERAAALARRSRAAARRWRLAVGALAAGVLLGAGALWLAFGALVQRAVDTIPAASETQLGASLFAAATAGRPRGSERDAALVAAACDRLQTAAGPGPYQFEVAVLESPEVNAFALPGGKIVVYSGLLAKAARPEEAAGVLAHEFEHVLLRHSLHKIVRAAGVRAAAALLFGSLEGFGAVVRDAGLQVQELSYDRDQERAADLAAIDLLARARIDPSGLPDFFARLAAEEGSATRGPALALLSTHPGSAERSARLREQIARLGPARYEPLPAR